jgi:hypothetical protein
MKNETLFFLFYIPSEMSAVNSSLLFLNTDDSQFTQNASDALFELDSNVFGDLTNFSLSLQSAELANTVYPINRFYNKIYFKENAGATLTASLDFNNYTGTEFASEVQTKLNSVGTLSYTVAYDNQSKKLSISTTIGNTFQLVEGTNDVYREMGYAVPTADSISLISDYPVRLDGSAWVDILSSVGHMNYSSNGRDNVLSRVPLNVPFGNVIFYENESDDFLRTLSSDISTLELRMVDDRNNPFELPNNSPVGYVLKLIRI